MSMFRKLSQIGFVAVSFACLNGGIQAQQPATSVASNKKVKLPETSASLLLAAQLAGLAGVVIYLRQRKLRSSE